MITNQTLTHLWDIPPLTCLLFINILVQFPTWNSAPKCENTTLWMEALMVKPSIMDDFPLVCLMKFTKAAICWLLYFTPKSLQHSKTNNDKQKNMIMITILNMKHDINILNDTGSITIILVSWDYDIPNIWKNKNMFLTTNQSYM